MYDPFASVVVVATDSPESASNSSKVTVLPFSPIVNSSASWIPLSLSSENTVDPTDTNLTKPKSIVMSPSLSFTPSLPPLLPGSPVGSESPNRENTLDVINPSVSPSPSVSCCVPLSLPSTPSSEDASVVEDTGAESGASNCMK